jgi:archaeal type IV pilus assembly protein PilA
MPECENRKPMSGKLLRGNLPDAGVSEVVGEMLMIALVIVLLSVFSAALYNFLPVDRDPSITVMMSNDRQNITLWHKGGDWVKAEDLTVIAGNNTWRRSYRYNVTWTNPDAQFRLVHPNRQRKSVFDLGSNITVRLPADLEGNETVKLVTPHTVIYVGKVGL